MGKANRSRFPGLPRVSGRKRLCDKDFRPMAIRDEQPCTNTETDGAGSTREQPSLGRGQLPEKSGFRFSKKACMPSFMSPVEARRPKSADSDS